MPWARLDDAFWSHPKVLAAGLEATGLHCRALSYVAGQGDGGLLSRDMVKMLAGSRWKTLAAKCVSVGLWHADGDGWLIHDYADPMYGNSNSSKAQARSDAARRAANVRHHGTADPPEPMRNGCGTHAEPHAERNANGMRTAHESDAELMRNALRSALPKSQSQSQSQSPFVETLESPSSAVKETREAEPQDLSDLQKQTIATLAEDINRLRPGIDKPQIEFQAGRLLRSGKSWPHIAIALIAVCLDPDTRFANRVSLPDGYWWRDNDTRTQKALTRWIAAGHRNPADALGVS